MKTNPRILFLALVLFFATKATAQDDSKFITHAASGGMMEVRLGKLAQERAASNAVKSFGRTMEADHSKANQQLKQIAENNHYDIPRKMLDEHQKKVDKLLTLSGKEFDEEYMDLMVKDHKEDIEAFEKAAKNATDAEIRNWAAQTVKVLKEHYEMARRVEEKVD